MAKGNSLTVGSDLPGTAEAVRSGEFLGRISWRTRSRNQSEGGQYAIDKGKLRGKTD